MDDDLDPAKGIILGIVLGTALWAVIFWLGWKLISWLSPEFMS